MKKIFLTLTALFPAVTAMNIAAQSAPADTVLKVTDARNVFIIESPQGVTFSIAGSETDSTFTASYTQQYSPNSKVVSQQRRKLLLSPEKQLSDSRWSIITGGLGLGMVKALDAPASMQLEMPKSFEIDWLYALGIGYNTPWKGHISLGIGFLWRNYRSTTSAMQMVGGKGLLQSEPWPDNSSDRYTSLKTFAIQFPLIYRQSTGVRMFGRDLAFSAGAILGVSTYASVKSGWTDADGRRVQRYTKNMGQRHVTVDLIAMVHPANCLGWYVRYSPQTTLTSTAGQPKFNALSTGLMLFF